MMEVWRGAINTWECDEMGHMNVRFYVAKAWEGMAALADRIGLPHAFRRDHGAILLPRTQHIRFLREIRPGQPVFLRAGVTRVGEDEADIHQEMVHAGSGEIAAVLRTRIAHLERWGAQPFAWPQRARAALNALVQADPGTAPARSLDPDGPLLADGEVSLALAQAHGVAAIGQGRFTPADGDINGRVRPEAFIGRISDSVPNLMAAWRASLGEAAGSTHTGAAVLEFRLAYRRWPQPGERWVLHSDIVEASPKTHQLVHWMLDPETGAPWVTGQAVAITFDLDRRKAIETPPDALAALRALSPGRLAM